jgi:hypothetical protein
VSGTFDLNDRDVFLRKIGSLFSAIVAFDSDGGSLLAGLQIGEIIRMKISEISRCWEALTLQFLSCGTQTSVKARNARE